MMTSRRQPEPELSYQLMIRTAGLQLFAGLGLAMIALAVAAPALLGATTQNLVLGSFAGIAGLAIAIMFFARARHAHRVQPRPIILRADHMLLPKGRYRQDTYQVAYDWVSRYALSGTGRPRLTIELLTPGEGETFTYSQADFASADDLFSVIEALGRRIRVPRRELAA